MYFYHDLEINVWRTDHEQRVRDAARHRRVKEARSGVKRGAAA